MNTLSKVIKHKDFLINEKNYNEERLLGVFLYGSQNYNFDTENSDVDTHAIYLPTFEEMCLKKEWLSKEYQTEDGEHINVKDIREYARMLKKQNINFVETLFTKYAWVNPKYEKVWNDYFVKNKEKIGRYNMAAAASSISHQALNTLHQSLVQEGKPFNYKKIANVCRLNKFLEKYEKGEPYEKCLKLTEEERENFLDIKNGVFNNDVYLLISDLDKTLNTLDTFPKVNEETGELIDNGVVAVLNIALNRVESKEEKEISLHNFFNKLTHAEERALAAITVYIKTEGIISVSTLVDETRISRPVYTNLFNKLKENKVAEVKNMGMKGTHVKIIHSGLKSRIEEGEL